MAIVVTCIEIGEPMKKKKRIDPTIIRMREERKKKRIEKQIRQLKKMQKQLKPINEQEVPQAILQEKAVRTQKKADLPLEVIDERVSLKKEWCEYKHAQFMDEMSLMDRLIEMQTKALNELRLESEDLYQKAIELDSTLLPYQLTGPTRTPPIENYDCPDGIFIDVSKKWDERPKLPPVKSKRRKK